MIMQALCRYFYNPLIAKIPGCAPRLTSRRVGLFGPSPPPPGSGLSPSIPHAVGQAFVRAASTRSYSVVTFVPPLQS